MALIKKSMATIYGLDTDINNMKFDLITEKADRQTEDLRENTRAVAAETAINNALTSEISRSSTNHSRLSADVAGEVVRAKAEEVKLRNDLASEVVRANAVEASIKTKLSIIDGDDNTAGSFRKAIKEIVGSAPAALDTLKEISDYINVGSGTDVLSKIISTVTSAKTSMLGTVSTAMDTFAEIEIAVNDEITRAKAEEVKLRNDLASEVVRANAVEADINARKLEKSDNLADVPDKVIARRNLNIYSKGETDGLIAASSNKLDKARNLSDLEDLDVARRNLGILSTAQILSFVSNGGAEGKSELLVVLGDSIVLTFKPKNGMILNFGTVRYTDITQGISYDIPITEDVTDITRKRFILQSDAIGQFNSKSVMVQYYYVAN